MKLRLFVHTLACALFTLSGAAAMLGEQPVRLTADLRDHQRGIFHAHMQFPVQPGALTLGYPKWLPGEHGPSGALNQIVYLSFHAHGKELPWRRDDVEMYNFHLVIPPGVQTIEADLDFATADMDEGFSATVAASDRAAVLNWWQVVLFPVDKSADDIQVAADLKLPAGWKFGTALSVDRSSPGNVEFAPVSLRTLIDSPVLAGEYFRAIPLGGRSPAELDLAGESEAAIAIKPDQVDHFRRLVAEAEALFGGAPYPHYHLLLCLSNPLAHYTLEHSASSDNRFIETALTDPEMLQTTASTIPHEYVHAWVGKARMPAGLATRNYQEPLKGELIWVYEGLTEYLGTLLTARSGFWTPEQFREAIALDAGEMATHPGRKWRSIQDTAIGVQLLNTAPSAWLTERRSTDFYPEGALIWMEADTLIRKRSGGARSLDDFCKAFLAPALDGAPKPYTLDDVVAALDRVQPYDWKTFFAERLNSHSPQPPTAGILAAGWKLTYQPEPTSLIHHLELAHKTDVLWPLWNRLPTVDARFSIGLMLAGDGTVIDTSRDMAAFEAGIAPGMRIVSVNGQPFAPEVLHRAIAATANGQKLVLVREHNGVQATATLRYSDGERFPILVRDPSQEDLVPQITAPQIIAPHAPGAGKAIR